MEVRSSFKPEDLEVEELEDLVWLGAGSSGLGQAFANQPPIVPDSTESTSYLSRIVKAVLSSRAGRALLSFYKISFKNDASSLAVNLAIVGQRLNLFFADENGMHVTRLQDALGFEPSPVIKASMDVLHPTCQWPHGTVEPSNVDILRCVHNNVDKPALFLKAGTHLLGADRYVGELKMPVSQLAQLWDEHTNHGRCMTVKDSYVVVAIYDSRDASKYMLLDLKLYIGENLDLAGNTHDDPCGFSYRCYPTARGTCGCFYFFC